MLFKYRDLQTLSQGRYQNPEGVISSLRTSHSSVTVTAMQFHCTLTTKFVFPDISFCFFPSVNKHSTYYHFHTDKWIQNSIINHATSKISRDQKYSLSLSRYEFSINLIINTSNFCWPILYSTIYGEWNLFRINQNGLVAGDASSSVNILYVGAFNNFDLNLK